MGDLLYWTLQYLSTVLTAGSVQLKCLKQVVLYCLPNSYYVRSTSNSRCYKEEPCTRYTNNQSAPFLHCRHPPQRSVPRLYCRHDRGYVGRGTGLRLVGTEEIGLIQTLRSWLRAGLIDELDNILLDDGLLHELLEQGGEQGGGTVVGDE